MTTCPSCQGANCERISVMHAKSPAASPHLAPPDVDRGARHLGLASLLMLLPAALHSPWWLSGTALLGLASLAARPIERRHHAQALADWARSCMCLDCGASWMPSAFGDAMADEIAEGEALPIPASPSNVLERPPGLAASSTDRGSTDFQRRQGARGTSPTDV